MQFSEALKVGLFPGQVGPIKDVLSTHNDCLCHKIVQLYVLDIYARPSMYPTMGTMSICSDAWVLDFEEEKWSKMKPIAHLREEPISQSPLRNAFIGKLSYGYLGLLQRSRDYKINHCIGTQKSHHKLNPDELRSNSVQA